MVVYKHGLLRSVSPRDSVSVWVSVRVCDRKVEYLKNRNIRENKVQFRFQSL